MDYKGYRLSQGREFTAKIKGDPLPSQCDLKSGQTYGRS